MLVSYLTAMLQIKMIVMTATTVEIQTQMKYVTMRTTIVMVILTTKTAMLSNNKIYM